MHAFGISEDDIEAVLRKNGARMVNAAGRSFEQVAEDLFDDIDHGLVERAALKSSTDLDEQTTAAHEEIERQLVQLGVLEAPHTAAATVPAPRRSRP
jgi:hypothetical protein